jgi:hypothetical protein
MVKGVDRFHQPILLQPAFPRTLPQIVNGRTRNAPFRLQRASTSCEPLVHQAGGKTRKTCRKHTPVL